MAPRWFGTCALAAIALLAPACGTDAVGVDACRQVQTAECQEAPACGIVLEPPYHTSGTDVDECIRFYNDACLHGLANGSDPGPTAVNQCVAAIHTAAATAGGCAIVADPSTSTACAWLAVSTSETDAASDSAEAASDASSDGAEAAADDGGATE